MSPSISTLYTHPVYTQHTYAHNTYTYTHNTYTYTHNTYTHNTYTYTHNTYTYTHNTYTYTHVHTPANSLSLQACDRGTPRMCSNTTVSLTVEDFNDEAPRFDLVQYRVDVFEDTPVDVILQPVATDGDSGTNAIIRYSLQVRLCVCVCVCVMAVVL